MRRRSSLLVPLCLALLLGGDALAKNDKWPPTEAATSADVAKPELWPDDPDYGYMTAQKSSERKKGQWNLYGFQPDRSPGTPPIRPDEAGKPVGMSVDLAWRYTTGLPQVTISILDSGIKWDESDLVEQAFLNLKELQNHKPRNAAGEACGGEGELAGFDCNGDGKLSASDYADDASMTPPEVEEGGKKYPRGDRNHNGLLDAGDIILSFSDGVDDDGNGYIDDISGWDFLMDDNDPYEDTRFYHGSSQARQVVAQANNGRGGAGVCPGCMFIPLRVGDSFITDVQEYAQAVAYSVDIGVSVIECALGTINMSSYAMAAVDYAWRNDVLVVASMADENSKHQNLPNTTNKTLQVHAIVNNGANGDVTAATSMLAFDPGTNYGGNNYLSASSEAASSGAAAVTSGVAGLVQSAARKYGKAPLAAGELFQLLTMTADDIHVPESQAADALIYWSQKGFDQRFGYGRVNANTAVEWVKAGKIPPVVDVTAPYWFENLYVDRLTGPVDIVGTISARRAASYDYVVEWGPGVQPLDEAFQVITEVKNVDGKTVSGEGAPLAQLDMTKIDPTHERDRDSPSGENDQTFTVRIRVVAHYGGEVGDVPGEIRRTYYARKDPDLLPGFPIRLVASGESSVKLADLDGDGKRDIIVADSDGNVHAFRASPTPQELPGFPFRSKRLDGLEVQPMTPGTASYLGAKAYQPGNIDPDVAREAFFGAVAVGDIDGDGKAEIVATSWSGTIYVIDAAGQARPGWPVRMPYVPSCPLDPTKPKPEVCMSPEAVHVRGAAASPVLADMNKDGKLDIIQAGFDGNVYVFDASGSKLPGWPAPVHYSKEKTQKNRIMTTPAVADLNGDGIPELLVGSSEIISEGGNAGAFYVLDGRGTAAPGAEPGVSPTLPNWPISVTSLEVLPLLGEGVTTAGAFADFDGDGKMEAVFHGNGSAPLISPADPGAQASIGATPPNVIPPPSEGKSNKGLAATSIFGDLSKARSPDTMFPLFAQPSIGDFDMDGVPDVAASGGSLSLAGNLNSKGSATTKPAQFLLSMWSGKTGKPMPASPVPLEDFTFSNNQAIADISGDGYPEVITGTAVFLVRAVDACGREAPGFPKNTGQWILSTVAVGDVDGDSNLDAVVATRNGWLYAWRTQGKTDGVIQWESFHHDNHNSGNYATRLDQGVTTKSLPPLDCSKTSTGESAAPIATGVEESDSGCGCAVPGGERSLGLAWLGLGLGLGLAARRRRAGQAR